MEGHLLPSHGTPRDVTNRNNNVSVHKDFYQLKPIIAAHPLVDTILLTFSF